MQAVGRRLCQHEVVHLLAGLLLLACAKLTAATALLPTRAEARLSKAGRGRIAVFDFRPDGAAHWKIRKATLILHLAAGDPPKSIAVSTVARKWSPANPAALHEAVFHPREAPFADCLVRVLPQRWIEVALEPWIAEWMVSGKSYGLAIAEDGRRISGRDPPFLAPYLLVEGEPPR